MLKLKKVAITGGISCGKTEFCRYMQELGAYYVSADNIVHQLLSPKTQLGCQIIDLLGSEIVRKGRIDRKLVARKVFASRGLLDKLEKMIHPAVFNRIENEYEMASKNAYPLFIAEIPLLFETKSERFFDWTISILSSEKNCLERLKNTMHKEAVATASQDYFSRMQRQLSPEQKSAKADIVVMNDGSKEELKKKAQEVFTIIIGVNYP